MAIEVQCEKCGQSLRAGPAMLGKKARCPKCSAPVLIKAADNSSADASAGDTGKKSPKKSADKAKKKDSSDAAAGWFVRADDGEFGPVEKAELDEWAAEGRLDAECEVRAESWPEDQWKSAIEVYPQIAGGESKESSTQASDDENDDFALAPLDGEEEAQQSAATKSTVADSDNPFAALEAADLGTAEDAISDLGFVSSQLPAAARICWAREGRWKRRVMRSRK